MNKWYNNSGAGQDCAISTRIRLARNISEIPFPHRATEAQKASVVTKTANALSGAQFGDGVTIDYIDMHSVSDIMAQSFVERHLISPEFAENRDGKALFMSSDEKISIMVNEEDHIRIQILSAGEDLKESLVLAQKIDDLFDSRLSYAYSSDLGYLTGCPTNLGTGLRASVMLFLPAIERAGYIGRLSGTLSKLGLVIRGTYGEGSEVIGSLYQVSNQVSLGITEETAVDNLIRISGQIIAQESALRKELFNSSEAVTEDRIMRAYGIAKYARLCSGKELLELTGLLRLGISNGTVSGIDYCNLNTLLFESGAANIAAQIGEECSSHQRDLFRAKKMRKTLSL